MLYYVEYGIKFTNLYGDIDKRFYSNPESMFAAFVMLLNSIENDSFYCRQSKRIRPVFEDTRNISDGGDFPMKWQEFILIYVFDVILSRREGKEAEKQY